MNPYIRETRTILESRGFGPRSRAWKLADSRLTECAVNQRWGPRRFAEDLMAYTRKK